MFMWGRGREGQLGVGSMQDNSVPKIVEELKGRKILKVSMLQLCLCALFTYCP